MQATTEADDNGRLHILEVIGNASKGGMENYIKNFLANLPPNHFRVTCICPYESPFTALLRHLKAEGIYITPIADDPHWRSIQLAVEVVRLHQIDVLHAHMPKAHILAGLAGCLLHKPVVATIHGMEVTAFEMGIARAIGSSLITNCQVAYTQALALGMPAGRVSIIQNGVDITEFTPGHSDNNFRNAIGIGPDTPLVGFVSRLEYEKGADLFIRAADYVHQLRPEVQFVLAGNGAQYKELNDMCSHMQLKQHVHFVGWWADMASLYPSLDLVVHPSRSDGTSLAVLEAMSCGRPVAALAVGGIPELIESGSTGVLAPANDWQSLGNLIVDLLDQPERLKDMGVAARLRVQQYFDLKTHIRRTTEVLRRVASGSVNGQSFAGNTSELTSVKTNNHK